MAEQLDPWKKRWNENRLGWHETNVHEALRDYGQHFIPGLFEENNNICASSLRVLVPLCGKSVDMAVLAQSSAVSTVVGIDAVPQALEAFVEEQPQLNIQKKNHNDNHTFSGTGIELLARDFFTVTAETTGGPFDLIFDRASLVAIDPSLRTNYVDTMKRLLKPGGRIFLVTIERRSGTDWDHQGPPFSVTRETVRELYESQEWIESVTLMESEGEKSRNKGTDFRSLYYDIQAKS